MSATPSRWTDPRDGAGVVRIALCDPCAKKRRGLRPFGLGVIAGACAGCGAVFCACRGELPCSNCPRKDARAIAPRLRAFLSKEPRR